MAQSLYKLMITFSQTTQNSRFTSWIWFYWKGHQEFGFIEKGRRSEILWHEITIQSNRFFINVPITCLDRVSFQLGKDYYKKHRTKDNENGCNKNIRLLATISNRHPLQKTKIHCTFTDWLRIHWILVAHRFLSVKLADFIVTQWSFSSCMSKLMPKNDNYERDCSSRRNRKSPFVYLGNQKTVE